MTVKEALFPATRGVIYWLCWILGSLCGLYNAICYLLDWIDGIAFNSQLRVSAGSIADMLIPYETVHNLFSPGRFFLLLTRFLQSELVGFGMRTLGRST